MGETTEDITVNDEPVSLSHEELVEEDLNGIIKRIEHLDSVAHDLQQAVDRIEKMVTEVHGEMQAAKPLIERWQHSAIRRLASGQFPWQAS